RGGAEWLAGIAGRVPDRAVRRLPASVAHMQREHPTRSLWSRGFARLWGANSSVQASEQVALLALPLLAALALEAGAGEMGMLAFALNAPYLLAGLVGGVAIDRMPAARAFALAALARALALLTLALLALTGSLSLPLLYALAFIAASGSVMLDIAMQAITPGLVARERLIAANSALEGSRAAATMAGPTVAGALAALLSAAGALAIAGLVGAAAAALVPAPRPAAGAAMPKLRLKALPRAILDGLRFVLRVPELRAVTLCAALWNASWGAIYAILVLHAARDLALAPAQIGLMLATLGVGSLLGTLAATATERRLGIGPVMVIGPALSAVGGLLIAFGGALASAAGLFLVGFGPTLYAIGQTALRQALTPLALFARVTAAMRSLTWGVRA